MDGGLLRTRMRGNDHRVAALENAHAVADGRGNGVCRGDKRRNNANRLCVGSQLLDRIPVDHADGFLVMQIMPRGGRAAGDLQNLAVNAAIAGLFHCFFRDQLGVVINDLAHRLYNRVDLLLRVGFKFLLRLLRLFDQRVDIALFHFCHFTLPRSIEIRLANCMRKNCIQFSLII